MSNKDFKLKNGLIVPSLSTAGVVKTDSSGVITSSATLSLTEGGTGQTTASNALNALLPLQTGNANYFLQTNEITSQWTKVYNQTIKNNGTTVTPRSIVNIIGGTFADSSGTDTTTIDLSGYISNTGGSTITASSASVKPLIIKGATSQTANLQEWQDQAGTVLTKVRSSGALNVGGAFSSNTFGVASLDPVWVASIVRGAASQTANLQEWQDSAGTVKAKIGADGAFTVGAASGYSNFDTYGNLYIRGAGYYSANVNIKTDATTTTGIVIRGLASQTASLTEWQTSAGTVIASIGPAGDVSANGSIYTNNAYFGGGASYYNATINIRPQQTSYKGIVIQGRASQTGNLQEWQDSAGTILSKVDSSGIIYSSTAASGTNTTQVATTQFVSTAVNNLINSAPGTLDTLSEIAAALNNDPNFYSTISTLTTALSSQDTYSLMGVF